MPLQNRVDPFGVLHARTERGTMMGNRGGRFHHGGALGVRRWASKAWICCLCQFKDRKRAVWGAGYTELFFLDEVTALAAGHRPCFECRGPAARAFQAAFGGLKAPQIDAILHGQRLASAGSEPHEADFATLPEGSMIAEGHKAYALFGSRLLLWDFSGYRDAGPRPMRGLARVITPAAIVSALHQYRPDFHASAGNGQEMSHSALRTGREQG